MEQEGQKEPRQLKIKGMGMDGVSHKGKLEKKERSEAGSKKWVLLILGITILACLVFSMKNQVEESVSSPVDNGVTNYSVQPTQAKSSGGGWSPFKPAEYEFGN